MLSDAKDRFCGAKSMPYSIRVNSCRWRPRAKNPAEFLRKPTEISSESRTRVALHHRVMAVWQGGRQVVTVMTAMTSKRVTHSQNRQRRLSCRPIQNPPVDRGQLQATPAAVNLPPPVFPGRLSAQLSNPWAPLSPRGAQSVLCNQTERVALQCFEMPQPGLPQTGPFGLHHLHFHVF